jgi:hypothetical protein
MTNIKQAIQDDVDRLLLMVEAGAFKHNALDVKMASGIIKEMLKIIPDAYVQRDWEDTAITELLYTHPAPPRELSDEEISELAIHYSIYPQDYDVTDFARAILKAAGNKECNSD